MSQTKVGDAVAAMLSIEQYRGWLLGKTLEQLGHLEVDPPERIRKAQQLLAALAKSYDTAEQPQERTPLEEISELVMNGAQI